MRRFAATVLLLVGVLVLGAARHATAAPEDWTISIDPASGYAGTTVGISGSGFDPSDDCASVWFGWDPESEGVFATPNADGFVEATIQVPDVGPGTMMLMSSCRNGEESIEGPYALFEVVVDPILTISPDRGRPGTKVAVSGSRFRCKGLNTDGTGGEGGMGPSAEGPVRLYWASRPDWRTEQHVEMDATFDTAIAVPDDLAVGEQELVVECRYGGGSAAESFTVLAAPPSPTPGPRRATEDQPGGSAAPGGGGTQESTPSGTPTESPPPQSSPPVSPTPVVTTAAPVATPTPVAAPTPVADVEPIRRSVLVPTPDRLPGSLLAFLLACFLAALLVLLIAFPAELFNKTYETHEEEIHETLHRLGVREFNVPPRAGMAAFTVFSAILALLFAGDEGADGNPIAQLTALVVAIPVVMIAYAVPAELYLRRRSGLAAVLRVLPTALVIATACAIMSWLLGLDPPYLYGLFAGFATAAGVRRSLPTRHEGRAILIGALSLAALGLAAWLLWMPFYRAAHGDHAGWVAVVADAVLFWILVLSAEGLVFALFPLRFLDGHRLRQWKFGAWFYAQGAAALFFCYVLVLRGELDPPDGGIAAVFKALGFFLIFGLASVGFWRYFQWPGRPTRLDRRISDFARR